MMASFNVTALENLGYDNVQGLDDPGDSRFAAEDWSADAYSDDSIQGRLSWLGSLGAYDEREQIASAAAAYYSGNSNPPVETGITPLAATATAQQGSTTQWSGNQGRQNHDFAPAQTQSWSGQNRGSSWGGQKGSRPWQA